MRNANALISGASIAGTTLAYWLHRNGFTPTVVERAPGIREGGYRGSRQHLRLQRRRHTPQPRQQA